MPLFASKPARLRGLALVCLGLFAIFSPLWIGSWAISLFGALIAVVGVITCFDAFRTADRQARNSGFVSGGLATALGLLIFAGPNLIVGGVIVVLTALLIFEGGARLYAAVRGARDRTRLFSLLNGLLLLITAAVLWRLHASGGIAVAGLALGIYCLSLGWTQLIAPAQGVEVAGIAATNEHPDARLRLPPHPEFGRLRAEAIAGDEQRHTVDVYWMSVLVCLFLLIHIGRTGMHISTLGLITPTIATIGDVGCAAMVGALFILPARLFWRRLTRPIERAAWRQLLDREPSSLELGERLTRLWLNARLRFSVRMRIARGSLSSAIWDIMESGLPLVAFIVAFNPFWGFTWYFNTENWASGFWDRVTAERTDPWRVAMMQAVEKAYPGVPPARLFAVDPPDSQTARDFSFIVIGDTGEGDASQLSLSAQLDEVARKPEVKFVVVSSDVIYPDGAMEDYEFKFYLPFHGISKPIYAIPGNHDWYNQLDSFCANFMEPAAARASMRARIAADLGFTITTEGRVDQYIAQAADLRRAYRIANGYQRAPFFELHYPGFSFIAVDTGIVRRVDGRQGAWLREALERSRGTFTMALLGHPLYAGGVYQGAEDPDFNAIHRVLREFEVPLVMAGDTHDFEYYRETYPTQSGPRDMLHFVNGGGGAYLSIGTAMDWPAEPPVQDWAYYPSTAALDVKLARETPRWKRPFWWWLHRWRGWPASAEVLSAVFDFNHAPFFQSFMEVKVEGSEKRVRLLLYGANGPLHWRDVQHSGTKDPDAQVEFVLPM